MLLSDLKEGPSSLVRSYRDRTVQKANVLGQAFGGPKITKDGVSVAKAITLKDPVENLGARSV